MDGSIPAWIIQSVSANCLIYQKGSRRWERRARQLESSTIRSSGARSRPDPSLSWNSRSKRIVSNEKGNIRDTWNGAMQQNSLPRRSISSGTEIPTNSTQLNYECGCRSETLCYQSIRSICNSIRTFRVQPIFNQILIEWTRSRFIHQFITREFPERLQRPPPLKDWKRNQNQSKTSSKLGNISNKP